jgi:hypothetical protein
MRTALAVVVAMAFQAFPERSPDLHLSARLIDPGASETAAVADVDRDGRLDILSGAYWYQAPNWTPYRFRDIGFQNGYLDSFSLMPVDVDGDGWMDVADVSWFGKKIAWWRNPGRAWGPSIWQEQTINGCCNVEFAMLVDVDGDGQSREIVAQENGTGQAWYEVRDGGWLRHQISDRTYGHGIGAGDVNGDGRMDILTPAGWLEAPPEPRAGPWTLHRAWADANRPIAPAGAPSSVLPSAPGAAPALDDRREQLGFMHVIDVNGDGRNDVLRLPGTTTASSGSNRGRPDGRGASSTTPGLRDMRPRSPTSTATDVSTSSLASGSWLTTAPTRAAVSRLASTGTSGARCRHPRARHVSTGCATFSATAARWARACRSS